MIEYARNTINQLNEVKRTRRVFFIKCINNDKWFFIDKIKNNLLQRILLFSLGARGQFLILYVHAKWLMESKGIFS